MTAFTAGPDGKLQHTFEYKQWRYLVQVTLNLQTGEVESTSVTRTRK